MIRALFFDFDGLILETETPSYQSFAEIFQEYQQALPFDKWAEGIGTRGPLDILGELEKKVGRPMAKEALEKRRFQREIELIDSLDVQPGVLEYLTAARRLNFRTAITSSSSLKWVKDNLERLGITEHFDGFITQDVVKRVKPDPEIYLTALDHFGLGGNEAIAFEDSPNGIAAAKGAGIFCVAVPNPITARLSMERADLRLDSLIDMPLDELIAIVDNHHS